MKIPLYHCGIDQPITFNIPHSPNDSGRFHLERGELYTINNL